MDTLIYYVWYSNNSILKVATFVFFCVRQKENSYYSNNI